MHPLLKTLKSFEEGNAVAKDAQESLDARQEKVIKENEQKTKSRRCKNIF